MGKNEIERLIVRYFYWILLNLLATACLLLFFLVTYLQLFTVSLFMFLFLCQ